MLNAGLKDQAIKALKAAQARHESEAKVLGDASARLFSLRQSSSEQIVVEVENYINTLANAPKKFNKTVAEYRAEFQVFNDIVTRIEKEASDVQLNASAGAGTGIVAGVGVAAFAPTAAMAVATTFGAASTGTAISALSGAAATNAALAWLGGGAIAAGGGGVAAGQAFLALAGPVGWAIGGTALVGAGLYARSKNREIAEDAVTETKKIETDLATLATANEAIKHLIALTEQHADGVRRLLSRLRGHAPGDYLAFSSDQKESLAALINHVHTLSALLNHRVRA